MFNITKTQNEHEMLSFFSIIVHEFIILYVLKPFLGNLGN